MANFLDAVRSRRADDLNAPVLQGHYSSTICHLGNLSWRLGRAENLAACREDMALIATQVNRCQESLRKLSATARAFSRQESGEQDARGYFTELVDRWLLMRPDVNARCEIADGDAEPTRIHTPASRPAPPAAAAPSRTTSPSTTVRSASTATRSPARPRTRSP